MALFRSSRPEVFCKRDVLQNFAKFTRKHLCQSLFFNKGLQLYRKAFTLFYRTPQVAASDFYKIRAGKFFWRNLYHRLKKYFKEQLCTFLERNECRQSLQYQSKTCANLCVFNNNPTRMRQVLLRSISLIVVINGFI